MRVLIRQARVGFRDHPSYGNLVDLMVKDGVIEAIGTIEESTGIDMVMSGQDVVVIPPLLDLYASSGEPNMSSRETFQSLARVAQAGGVGYIAHHPSISNHYDHKSDVAFLAQRTSDQVVWLPVANIELSGQKGKMSEILEIKEAGARAFTNQSNPNLSPDFWINAFEYSRPYDIPILVRPEVPSLNHKGHIHRGDLSLKLGLKGMPAIAETLALRQILSLAKFSEVSPVVIHISSAESLEIIREYKSHMPLKAGVAIHHLIYDESVLADYDTNYKVNPPLRTHQDREALRQALLDGTLDFVYSQHTPCTPEEKIIEFDYAEFGAIGIQTMLHHLIDLYGKERLEQILDWVAYTPYQIFNLPKPILEANSRAQFAVLDLDHPWTFDPSTNLSMGQNAMDFGTEFHTRVYHTFV